MVSRGETYPKFDAADAIRTADDAAIMLSTALEDSPTDSSAVPTALALVGRRAGVDAAGPYRVLDDDDRRDLIDEAISTLRSGGTDGWRTALATLVDDWRASAQIRSDQVLAADLSTPIEEPLDEPAITPGLPPAPCRGARGSADRQPRRPASRRR
ncbi:hypothetical protein ASQ49_02750 [Acidipropionibacterium acidipropionici]|nr:hypothetical protein ASQ49_02750 [Acidipropionibacterium acidipropionici]APZ09872.1 hypothetical protein BWX38_12200 [Acidipropionibacterium acidipropionici]